MIRIFVALLVLVGASSARAGILWAGGEDIDFPNGSPVTLSTSYARSGYARVSFAASSPMSKSTLFPGGPVTSAWLSARLYYGGTYGNLHWLGFGKSGTNAGLFIGNTTTSKVALYKYDGTTWTLLAAEAGATLPTGLSKFDVQVIDFGTTGTVNVYINGTLSMTYTGNIAAGGITNFDSVYVPPSAQGNSSEVIVADEDTRLFSLVTLAPNASGDTNAWTGTYSSINEMTTNDASVIFSSSAGQEAQFHVSDLPAGQFAIKGVKLNMRACESGTSIGTIHLGVRTNGSSFFDGGHSQATAWATQELFLPLNPNTSDVWLPSDINGLQITFRSAQ